MSNIFKPKRSSVSSSVPTTGQLADGELAVNSSDRKIFIRDGGSIVEIANYSLGTGSTSYWIQTNSGIHTLSNVGIGTTNPTQKLDVDGNVRIRSALYDVNNNVGVAGSVLTSTTNGSIVWKPIKRTVGVSVDGGGSVITTGTKGYIEVPYSGTIEEWKIVSDISGSVVFDVWKSNATIPTNANTITASAKPTLTNSQRATSTTLTGWTSTVSENDVFGFEVESASTITKATLILVIKQT